ncbi:hypothetical protein FEK35_12520 [Nocardia cyriacigeorgica]|uniref:Uncharacterized protein n=1 Tax=Nocardia cyriacigeorgica TaxID=135487 RepID=A0A5R8PF81_9NOCA|nr:hypothetical protein [Nocardia cyriacigeorgica]TLG11512.1 hypothetical protein FEK35_12520 [Nocardia cyriacigeorgica]
MSYGDEIERIAEECRWRSARLLDDLAEINRRTADKSRELAEQSAIEMRQVWENMTEELEKAEAEAEKERLAAEERERLEAEAREQREAIARSMQARRSKDVVAPIDEDDEEAQYYQRKSWLV